MVEGLHDWRDRYATLPLLLEEIPKRPAMFFGKKTVYGLHVWLSGIVFAQDFHRLPVESWIGGFDRLALEGWVETEFNPRPLSVNSFWLAEQIAESDSAGFDLWFEWYDAFRAARPAEKSSLQE